MNAGSQNVEAPKLRDVARAAQVSPAAASVVLRGRTGKIGVSEPVRHRIQEAARTLGYRPHRVATSLRSQNTRVIGFVAPSGINAHGALQNYGIHPFVIGLNHHLIQQRHHVAYMEIGEFEFAEDKELPQVLQERFFDGLVVHYGLSSKARERFSELHIPVVWWDSGVFASLGCIYRDEAEVTRQVTRRLIELGHRRIGFMVGETGWENYQRGKPMHYSYVQRYESYCAELNSHGLEKAEIAGYEISSVSAQLQKHEATAVITQGAGESTLLLYQAATALGKQVPRNLSIVSLDLEARIPQRAIKLGGMLYDRYEAGQKAAGMMLEVLNGAGQQVPSIKVIGEFQVGDTVGSAGR